jgi:hypothetical protein
VPVYNATSQRLHSEFKLVSDVLGQSSESEVNDPLGQDGRVQVVLRSPREYIYLKTSDAGDKRWTRFRTWGGADRTYVEKSSFLRSASGATEFHKRRSEPEDNVLVWEAPDGDDQGWINNLA